MWACAHPFFSTRAVSLQIVLPALFSCLKRHKDLAWQVQQTIMTSRNLCTAHPQHQAHNHDHLLISFTSCRKGFASRSRDSLYRMTHCRPWGSISMQQQAGTIAGNLVWVSPRTALHDCCKTGRFLCCTNTHKHQSLLGYSHGGVQVETKETHKPFQ